MWYYQYFLKKNVALMLGQIWAESGFFNLFWPSSSHTSNENTILMSLSPSPSVSLSLFHGHTHTHKCSLSPFLFFRWAWCQLCPIWWWQSSCPSEASWRTTWEATTWCPPPTSGRWWTVEVRVGGGWGGRRTMDGRKKKTRDSVWQEQKLNNTLSNSSLHKNISHLWLWHS